MPDLAALTLEGFQSHLEQLFHVDRAPGPPLALRLLEVRPRGAFDPEFQRRQAFSLVFRGPPEPLLVQRIYALHHPDLGALAIFLVPLGPDREGMRYEAVFT